jgi:hypothetical protein
MIFFTSFELSTSIHELSHPLWTDHYAKMWFLWLGHVANIAQNNHVVVIGIKSQSFWKLKS